LDRKQKIYFTAIAAALVLVFAILLLTRGFHWKSGGIVLPENPSDAAGLEEEDSSNRLHILTIAPETVQPAISTLSRPLSYSRTQTVETFWSGGSGQSISQVYVSGSTTRLDTALPDGSTRHTLVAGSAAAVWYDDETSWTTLHARQLTADAASRMLTYETVRDLPAGQIAAADYRDLDGVACIYVETAPDSGGYADRYWVSVEWGLLCAAERSCNGTLIYRFTATAPGSGAMAEELFTLPDGSKLEPPPQE